MRRTVVLALLALLLTAQAAAGEVWRITLDQPITPVSEEYITKALADANTAGASLVILRIDTPGGFVSSVEAIQRAILQSKTPVVAWVGPVNARAASGGALVALSCDLIAMAPGTTIGSAHPVSSLPIPLPTTPPQAPQPENGQPAPKSAPESDVMMEKVLNDLAAHARSLADGRGRNAAVFEKMLRESISLTEKEALDQKAIEVVAATEGELLDFVRTHDLKRFDGPGTRVALDAAPAFHDTAPSLRQRLLAALTNPNLTLVLLLVGLLGLYIEFKAPGLIFPGILGGICILLFALSTQLLPVNAVGLLLIVLGVVFIILELKVVSYGMLGIGGVVSLLIGGLTLYRNSPIPELKVSLFFLVPVVLAFAAIMIFLVALAVRTFRTPVLTGDGALVGQRGTVSQAIAPGRPGKVFVFGEYWNATADADLPEGAAVEVVSRLDMVVHVKPFSPGGAG